MMDLTYSFRVDATLVANEFIDRYMAEANGEYVKVYLYLLRHQQEKLDVEQIADALNHTETDVKRALLYWEKLGALQSGTGSADPGRSESVQRAQGSAARKEETAAVHTAEPQPVPAAQTAASRPAYSRDQVNRLQGDGDFSQLLYIAQRYLNKIFTQRELEVFAYLYDGLHMPVELLEYLVEHCVQSGHMSMRYIETVALNWHEKGLKTVEDAKSYASGFTKDSFSVMKAFGLTDRKPGNAEKEMIERWFGSYGFTRELVLEACNRTLESTHNPSFRYADKILSEWKKEGVRNLKDVAALDEKRRGQTRTTPARTAHRQTNQFHNFDQRSTDYDSMVLDQVKDWIGDQQ